MQSFERLAPYVGKAVGLSDDALARACQPATKSQIPAILELRRAIIPDMWWDDEQFVRWRYFSDRGINGEAPYWVFVKGAEVLAACGLEPVTLVVDGSPLPAVRTLDIMVRPDLDGLGLGAFMNLALFKRFPVVLVTGSNQRSHNLLTRMFHHTTDLRFWKLPVSGRLLLDARIGLGPLAALAALPVDALLRLRRAAARLSMPAGVVIRELTEFGAEVVELSRRCEVPGRLLVRRSDEYLNWRFVRNPRCRYEILGAFSDRGLEGYVVTRFNRARPNQRREADIVDWLAPGAASFIFAALVRAAVERLIRSGAGIITCAAASAEAAVAMQANGFYLRPDERLPFFVRAADPALHSRLTVASDWFLTRGDFDVE
jgi:hypothetical protein